jgi:hypothetical protein
MSIPAGNTKRAFADKSSDEFLWNPRVLFPYLKNKKGESEF